MPVPSGTPTGLKTPRDVMRNRQEREARRQEEAKAEEQRRVQLLKKEDTALSGELLAQQVTTRRNLSMRQTLLLSKETFLGAD